MIRRLVRAACRTGVSALVLLSCCAAASGSPDDRVRFLARVDSLHVAHRVAAAESLLAPRLAEARAASDSSFVLPLVAKLGRLHASYGRPRTGEPLLAEAADLAAALRDTLRWCDALRWLGYALDQQGRPAEAGEIYVRLRGLAVATADSRHEAWSLVGLAYLATRAGRYADAERDYLRAADLFHALGDAQPEVWALSGLGAALHEAGRLDAARACYERVLALARDVGYEAVAAMAENNLGALVFAVGDPGEALAHYRNALAIQRSLAQRQDAVVTGGNIADCLLELGRYDEAEVLLDELRAECVAGGFLDRTPSVHARLVQLRRLQGRQREAAAIARGVLADDAGVVDIGDRVKHLVGLSQALAAQDSLGAALAVLAEGAARWGAQAGGESALRLRLELGRAEAAAGRDAEAVATLDGVVVTARAEGLVRPLFAALTARAAAQRRLGHAAAALAGLREAARVWETVRDAPRDPQWREQRGATGGGLAAALASAVLAEDAGRDAAAFDEIQVFKARTLSERIGLGGTGPRTPVGAAELGASVLDEGELLLDYYLGAEESLVFAVSREGVRIARLGPAAVLEGRARLFRDLVAFAPATPGVEALETAAVHLAALVFGDLEELVAGSEHVVAIPDGALNLVPFSLLTPGRVGWTRAPSATILAALREQAPERPAGEGVLAFASSRTRDGRRLPGAVREVRSLASRYRDVTTVITGAGSSGGAPDLEDLPGYAVLHLATHARADDQSPWASTILVDPDASGEEAAWRADRIAHLSLRADLVVLSACETASGRVLSGEGVLGLSSAFLAAGAPALLATLWPVDDAATAVMMEEFYRELASGLPAATALDRARSVVRQVPATHHPFYWSGFVLIGDGHTCVDLTPRPSRVPAVAGVGILALLLALRVLHRRRSH